MSRTVLGSVVSRWQPDPQHPRVAKYAAAKFVQPKIAGHGLIRRRNLLVSSFFHGEY
jgi:hypothetical protein